jgi:hypothetical protein
LPASEPADPQQMPLLLAEQSAVYRTTARPKKRQNGAKAHK